MKQTKTEKPETLAQAQKRAARLELKNNLMLRELTDLDIKHSRTVNDLDAANEELSEARECISALTKAIRMHRLRADLWKKRAKLTRRTKKLVIEAMGRLREDWRAQALEVTRVRLVSVLHARTVQQMGIELHVLRMERDNAEASEAAAIQRRDRAEDIAKNLILDRTESHATEETATTE